MNERLHKAADEAYDERVSRNTPEAMRYIEKQVILQSLDHLWRDHLVTLDHLRQVIGWRGLAQRDPLNEYKSEAFELFKTLIERWHEEVIAQMMRIEVRFQAPEPAPPPMQFQHLDPLTGDNRGARSARSMNASASAELSAAAVGVVAAPTLIEAAERNPKRPVDLGQGRPQRGLPVRVGQEIQALPRGARLNMSRTLQAGVTRGVALRTLRDAAGRRPGLIVSPPTRASCLCAADGINRADLIGDAGARAQRGGGRPSRADGGTPGGARARVAHSGAARVLGSAAGHIAGRARSASGDGDARRGGCRRIGRTSAPRRLRILDLGVGSGAILCALLTEFGAASGVAVDLSPPAAAQARANLVACGLAGRARGRRRLLGRARCAASFDVVVSNPPYVASGEIGDLQREVRDHDPALALDGGLDGLDAYRAIGPQLERLAGAGRAVLSRSRRGTGR